MSDDERKRLVITEEDLIGPVPPRPASASGSSYVGGVATGPSTRAATPPTSEFPAVQGLGSAPRPVGATPRPPATSPAVFLLTVRGRNLAAATCGIALGWAVCEITGLGLWSSTSAFGQDLTVGIYTGAVGFFFAVVYAGWEQILARNWEGIRRWLRAAGPSGFGLALVSGFVAQIVYRHFVIQIFHGLTLEGLLTLDSNIKLYLTRALAWGMFGSGMGVAVAGSLTAGKKLVNGVLGGAIGGALGGFAFHWASFNISSGAMGRLIGLLVVGIAIGAAIGIVEVLRRDAWLHLTGGPMAGKEFIVYGPSFTLGSSPKCDVTLIKDQTVQPFHAVISTVDQPGRQVRVIDAYRGGTVLINGTATTRHELRSGDVIGLGASAIAYSERTPAV